jgi:hypothetical protein
VGKDEVKKVHQSEETASCKGTVARGTLEEASVTGAQGNKGLGEAKRVHRDRS